MFNDTKHAQEAVEEAVDNLLTSTIEAQQKEIDTKFGNIAEVVDHNIECLNQQIQENSSKIKETTKVYNNLSQVLENKILKENQKFEEYSNLIKNLSYAFDELSEIFKEELSVSSHLNEEKFKEYQKEIESRHIEIQTSIDTRLEDYRKDLVDIKTDVAINEQHIKNVDNYLQENHKEIVQLKEEVFSQIEKLPVGNLQENLERLEKKIDYIKETYSKIESEDLVKEVISEGLLNEPPETKNSDSLTPLNQNFVTLEQLQEHYRLFINRIQQQLATIGGGGETQLKYLDDVVGIATDPSSYDGKFLKYDHSLGKFVFETVSGGGGGIQGIQGIQGTDGSNGTQGTQGTQGTDGATGTQGIAGSKGFFLGSCVLLG